MRRATSLTYQKNPSCQRLTRRIFSISFDSQIPLQIRLLGPIPAVLIISFLLYLSRQPNQVLPNFGQQMSRLRIHNNAVKSKWAYKPIFLGYIKKISPKTGYFLKIPARVFLPRRKTANLPCKKSSKTAASSSILRLFR